MFTHKRGMRLTVTHALLLAAFLSFTQTACAREYVKIEPGAEMPGFRLADVNGKEYELAKFRDKSIVVLVFCSQECPYSRKADPILSSLSAKYKDNGVVFLGIDSHMATTPDQIREYSTKTKLAYPVLKDFDNQYADLVGATRTPEVFIVGKDGRLVYHGGPNNQKPMDDPGFQDYVSTALDSLLADKPVEAAETDTWGCSIKRGPAKEAAGSPGQGTQETGPPVVKVVDTNQLVKTVKETQANLLVMNVWATWCPPCVAEMPEIVEFQQTYKDMAGFSFLSVSVDSKDSIEDALKPFMTRYKMDFPVLVLDAEGTEQLVAGLGLEATGWDNTIPATFFFDANKKLVKAWLDQVTLAELKAEVERTRSTDDNAAPR